MPRFVRETRVNHPLFAVFQAPRQRLMNTSMGERIIGVLSAFVGFLLTDAFMFVTLLLVASGTADTIYGRALHKKLDNYDQLTAEIGLLSKVMGIVMVLLIRGFEGWWSRVIVNGPFDGWHTAGFLSMSIAVTLFVHDLKSIQEKRIRFGQPPLPVLTQVLKLLDTIAASMGAGPNGHDLVERRQSDPHESKEYQRRASDRDEEDS